MRRSEGVLKLLCILGAGILGAGYIVSRQGHTKEKPVALPQPIPPPPWIPTIPPPDISGTIEIVTGAAGGLAATVGAGAAGAAGGLAATVGAGAKEVWDTLYGWFNDDLSFYRDKPYPTGASDTVTAPQPAYPKLGIEGLPPGVANLSKRDYEFFFPPADVRFGPGGEVLKPAAPVTYDVPAEAPFITFRDFGEDYPGAAAGWDVDAWARANEG